MHYQIQNGAKSCNLVLMKPDNNNSVHFFFIIKIPKHMDDLLMQFGQKWEEKTIKTDFHWAEKTPKK